jgi:lipopolysaccharide export system permease protein
VTLIGSDDAKDTAELHWRFGVILSAPIMALLAFPLSYTTPRQGRFGKLAVGILLYALYANLLITGKSMLEDEKIPSILGLWWVHLPFLILSLGLVWRRYGGLR